MKNWIAIASFFLLGAAPVLGAPGVDRYGDPLPSGAVTRLGSTRWRTGACSYVEYSRDGKSSKSKPPAPRKRGAPRKPAGPQPGCNAAASDETQRSVLNDHAHYRARPFTGRRGRAGRLSFH